MVSKVITFFMDQPTLELSQTSSSFCIQLSFIVRNVCTRQKFFLHAFCTLSNERSAELEINLKPF